MNTVLRNAFGFIPLHLASIWGHSDVVEVLIRYEIMMIQAGRVGIFGTGTGAATLLEDSEDFSSLEVADRDQHTALHLAVIYDEPGVVQSLLRHHANVTAVDGVLWTPLHLAALKGTVGVMKVLLNHIVYQHLDPLEHYAYIYHVLNAKNLVSRPCLCLPLSSLFSPLVCFCSTWRRPCTPPVCTTRSPRPSF